MKKIMIAFLVLLAFPALAQAAHVLIWLYDDGDKFIDPQLGGDTIDCAYWIEQTLLDNGHSYDTETYLPYDLSSYDVVFVTLGFFRC